MMMTMIHILILKIVDVDGEDNPNLDDYDYIDYSDDVDNDYVEDGDNDGDVPQSSPGHEKYFRHICPF